MWPLGFGLGRATQAFETRAGDATTMHGADGELVLIAQRNGVSRARESFEVTCEPGAHRLRRFFFGDDDADASQFFKGGACVDVP